MTAAGRRQARRLREAARRRAQPRATTRAARSAPRPPRTRSEVTDTARAETQKAIDEATAKMRAETDAARAAAAAAGQRARAPDREQAARPGGRVMKRVLIVGSSPLLAAPRVRATAPRRSRRRSARRAADADSAGTARRTKREADRSDRSTSTSSTSATAARTSTAARSATASRTDEHGTDVRRRGADVASVRLHARQLRLFLLHPRVSTAARPAQQARRGAPRPDQERARRGRQAARRRPKTKLAEYETRIKGVDAEIKKLVDGIRADAEADKARILEPPPRRRPRR